MKWKTFIVNERKHTAQSSKYKRAIWICYEVRQIPSPQRFSNQVILILYMLTLFRRVSQYGTFLSKFWGSKTTAACRWLSDFGYGQLLLTMNCRFCFLVIVFIIVFIIVREAEEEEEKGKKKRRKKESPLFHFFYSSFTRYRIAILKDLNSSTI